MIYFKKGSIDDSISLLDLREALFNTFEKLGGTKVLAIPPDFTRFHSFAGPVTEFAWEYYGDKLTDILPALGTHTSMTLLQIKHMFGHIPENLFRNHDWRNDILTLGEVPSEYVNEISEKRVNYSWPAQVNKLLINGKYDLIFSIGQVVPHEVIGMANYNKNIFVGTGGLKE